MYMQLREFRFYFFHYFAVIKNIPIRKETALNAHFRGIDLNSFSCFFKYLGDGQNITLRIPESAEPARPHAPVRKINVPVDHVGNFLSGRLLAKFIGKGKKKPWILIKCQSIFNSAFSRFNTTCNIFVNTF